MHDEVNAELFGYPVAILDHCRDLVFRIHMDEREWHMTIKGLLGQPQQHGRILADRPEHPEFTQFLVRFPQNIDAFCFQLIQMVHCHLHSLLSFTDGQ